MSDPQKMPIAIGSTPLNWKTLTVEAVCKIMSSAMSYKQLLDAPNVENGIRVIGVKVSDMNLPGNEIEFHSANLERTLSEKEALKRTVPKNSIVFPKRGAAIATNKKRLTICDTVLDPNLIAVTPSDSVDHHYLFYWFNTFDLKRITNPGPTPQLNKKDIAPLYFPLPPLPEQKKIAHVLSTVQQAIEAQERIIQTTTELKKALMHKLFTEGLHGEPQKQTEIGPVPESWDVLKIGEIANLKSGGTPSRSNPTYWDGGAISWIKTGEVNYCTIVETEEKITTAGLAGSSAKLFPAGTLLMAMYGQGITRGKVAVTAIEAATNQACAAIFPTVDVRVWFLYYFLEHHYSAIRSFAHGANQKNLSADLIKSFPVAYPRSQNHQDKIVEILNLLDQKIQQHIDLKLVQGELFRTLLHELMTGKTRVHEYDFPITGFDE